MTEKFEFHKTDLFPLVDRVRVTLDVDDLDAGVADGAVGVEHGLSGATFVQTQTHILQVPDVGIRNPFLCSKMSFRNVNSRT